MKNAEVRDRISVTLEVKTPSSTDLDSGCQPEAGDANAHVFSPHSTSDVPNAQLVDTTVRLLRVCSLRLAVLVYGELYDDKRNNKNACVTPIRSGHTRVTADRYRQATKGSKP